MMDKRKGNWLATGIVVAITVVALLIGNWFVGRDDATAATSAVTVEGAFPAPKVGQKAPEFLGEDLDGAAVPLQESKPVWLLFMASWCQECRVEAPDVQAAFESRDDVDIRAVYVGEDAAATSAYADRLGLTFPQIPDPHSELGASYGVSAIPAHYFIGADGVVRDVAFGALSASAIDEKLDALVGAG